MINGLYRKVLIWLTWFKLSILSMLWLMIITERGKHRRVVWLARPRPFMVVLGWLRKMLIVQWGTVFVWQARFRHYACTTRNVNKLNMGIPFYGRYWKNVGDAFFLDPLFRSAYPTSGFCEGNSVSYRDIPKTWHIGRLACPSMIILLRNDNIPLWLKGSVHLWKL